MPSVLDTAECHHKDTKSHKNPATIANDSMLLIATYISPEFSELRLPGANAAHEKIAA